jgi:microcystin-dependent protein
VTGDFIPTGRNAARLGTILALGQAVNRVQYAGLFAAFGTTYGAGDGSTTFNLPDLRGRAVLGTDQGANRLKAQIAGTLGSVGGVEEVQYNVTGTAASVSISGTANVTGTAWVLGTTVHVTGTTDPDPGDVFVSGNTIQAAVHPHQHTFQGYGTVTGNATCDASGPITGWTAGGAAVTGITDKRTNLPPSFCANYLIAL